MRFSRTVSHGNTDPCWEIRIPLESGFERATPSMSTAPESGRTNPAIMFISVDFPQPEGPTTATNSPSPTVKLTSSTTCSNPLSDGKLFFSPRTSTVVLIAPPDPTDPFQSPHDRIERQADEADDDHPGDDEVVAIPGVARIHDHVAESGVQGDHLGGYHDQPRDTQSDAHADQNLGQHGRNHDLFEQCAARDAEILRRP